MVVSALVWGVLLWCCLRTSCDVARYLAQTNTSNHETYLTTRQVHSTHPPLNPTTITHTASIHGSNFEFDRAAAVLAPFVAEDKSSPDGDLLLAAARVQLAKALYIVHDLNGLRAPDEEQIGMPARVAAENAALINQASGPAFPAVLASDAGSGVGGLGDRDFSAEVVSSPRVATHIPDDFTPTAASRRAEEDMAAERALLAQKVTDAITAANSAGQLFARVGMSTAALDGAEAAAALRTVLAPPEELSNADRVERLIAAANHFAAGGDVAMTVRCIFWAADLGMKDVRASGRYVVPTELGDLLSQGLRIITAIVTVLDIDVNDEVSGWFSV